MKNHPSVRAVAGPGRRRQARVAPQVHRQRCHVVGGDRAHVECQAAVCATRRLGRPLWLSWTIDDRLADAGRPPTVRSGELLEECVAAAIAEANAETDDDGTPTVEDERREHVVVDGRVDGLPLRERLGLLVRELCRRVIRHVWLVPSRGGTDG